MSHHRLDELAMRRRQLLLRNERLRADLAADHQVVLQAISGVDRILSASKGMLSPILIAGAGALFFRLFKRVGPVGFAMKGLFWISTVRRFLPYIGVIRSVMRSRSRARPDAEPGPQP